MSSDVDLSNIQLASDLRDRRITADYVADALRQAIYRGDLADGAVMNQAALAAHFGVSRVPVREAMRELQAEGLIDTRAHRVAIVKGLDLDRLTELYDLRALLEGYLAERSTPVMTAAQLEALAALERAMRAESDHMRWLELNTDFHRMLCEPSRAVTTIELVENLRLRAERYARLWSRGAGLHRPDEAGREHAEIVRLVSTGDGAGARAAVEQHIAHTRDRMIAYGQDILPSLAAGDAGAAAS